jgi:hypothetical protein
MAPLLLQCASKGLLVALGGQARPPQLVRDKDHEHQTRGNQDLTEATETGPYSAPTTRFSVDRQHGHAYLSTL